MKIKFRKAETKDVAAIVGLLANDELGRQRERYVLPLPVCYLQAFEQIAKDKNQELVVVENDKHEIIGTLQLTFIQYLTYQGGLRAQIEAVRVHEDFRGSGLGQKMFEWAIDKSKSKGAHLVQLTTDKKRPNAIKFYEKLGFVATHEGMKMSINSK